jgi:hypothetical protein
MTASHESESKAESSAESSAGSLDGSIGAGIPVAVAAPETRRSLFRHLIWLVPIAALAASIAFSWLGTRDRGPIIVIHAAHGFGVGKGDPVRYLGIDVGVVRSVRLAPSGDEASISLEVQLAKDAGDLARAGTQFWVVRPQLSLDSIDGLETIIGARYITLFPGPKGAERRTQFTALSEPPLADEIRGGMGLEIVLDAPTRFGIQSGAGITYRGVRIGTVIAVGLASDATSVEVRVRIREAYAQLVREGSVFWETGGFEFGLSLTGGLDIDLDSLRTALIGGVAMATPVNSGAAVTTGTRFPLAADVREEWLEWAPALPLGSELLPPGVALPRLLRATLTWEEGRILRSKKTLAGWMHATPEGLIGPWDMLQLPEDAREGRAVLSVAGRSFDMGDLAAPGVVRLASAPMGRLSPALFGDAWDGLLQAGDATGGQVTAPRSLSAPEDLILFRDVGRDPLGIDASRLRIEGDRVTVDRRIAISADWHGALAMARSDGAVVGVVMSSDDEVAIFTIP